MPDYLLPCSCGHQLTVSTRHAGQAASCPACGAQLEVPTLRGLDELEPATSTTKVGGRVWGDRQRLVFVLSAAALGAAALAGFLATRLPEAPSLPPPIEVDQNSPIGDVYLAYDDLQQGVDVPPPSLSPFELELVRHRELMLWEVGIIAGLATIALVVAVVVALSGRRQKR